jgi:hypothetical protein
MEGTEWKINHLNCRMATKYLQEEFATRRSAVLTQNNPGVSSHTG